MSDQPDLAALDDAPPDGPHDPLGILVNIVAAIGTLWTFLLMFLIIADVVGRSFLSMPITGVAEIAAHSIVAIVFLQLAANVHARRLTRADFLLDRIHAKAPKLGVAIETIFLLSGVAIMMMIAYASWKPLINAFSTNEYFGVRGVFTIATWPFRAIIVGGAGLAGLVFLVQAGAEALRLRPSTRQGI